MNLKRLVPSFLCGVLVLFLANHSTAAGSVRFVKNRVALRYPPCYPQDIQLHVDVVNSDNKPRTFDIISTSKPSDWRVAQLPEQQATKTSIAIKPGETMWMVLGLYGEAPTYSVIPDTFIVVNDDGFDTLVLELLPTDDTISLSGSLEFGTLPLGKAVRRTLSLVNLGAIPYQLRNLYASGLTLSGYDASDSLLAGESMQFDALLDASVAGRHDLTVAAYSYCSQHYLYGTARVFSPHAYWTIDWLDDTIRGCGEGLPGKTFDPEIRNDEALITTIDSIGYWQYERNGWSFDEEAWKGVQIVLGRSKPFTLVRDEGARSTKLIIYANGRRADVLDVRAGKRIALPKLIGLGDSLSYPRKSGDTLRLRVTLENIGDEPYWVTRTIISDPFHWSIVGFDTSTPVTRNNPRSFYLRFKGSNTPGSYPVTLSIQGEPCDTILSRTVFVTIASSDVEAERGPFPLRVFPIPASSILHLDAPFGAESKLVDHLGREVMSMTSSSCNSDLDVRRLPTGSYILVVSDAGRNDVRRVTIAR